MNTLYLYTTSACHLCEQAEALVKKLQLRWRSNQGDFSVELIEISDDPVLVTRYGVRIPVVRLSGQDSELGWPFSDDDLNSYLLKATALV